MQACKTTLLATLDAALALAGREGLDAALRGRAPELRRALDAYRPALMMYGLYNAGKSTLINAMLGADEARVADAPCTDRVGAYAFGEYELLDTPGLDAPITHEQVSEDQLARTHVVAFVIGTDTGFEETSTVQRLASLVMQRKPLVVVLNDKGGAIEAGPEVQRVLQQVRGHLLQQTGSPDLVAAVPIVTVNAAAGLRGRLEGKARLLEASGVPQLEQVLLDQLLRTSGDQLLLPALDALDGELVAMRAGFLRAVGTAEAQALEGLRQQVARARQGFTERLAVEVRASRASLARELEAALTAGQPLEPAMARFVARINEAAAAEVATLQAELGEVAGAPPIGRVEAGAAAGPLAPLPRPGGAGDGSGALVQLGLEVAGKALRPEHTQPAFRAGLDAMRSLKVPGIKGRWDATLDRWAGGLSRGVGVMVQVATAAWQIKQAIDAQQAAEQAAIDDRRRLHDAAEATADDLRRDVERQLPALGRQVFGELEAELGRLAATADEAVARRQEALGAIDGWRETLADLRAPLGGGRPSAG